MLAKIIKASGRTRADWAGQLGVSASYLSDLLNGKKQPSLELAVKIERITCGEVSPSMWLAPAPTPDQEDAA